MVYNRFNPRNDQSPYTGKTYDCLCPYCNQDVFYYEKEHRSGRTSKVFFEELGDPWPPHLCEALLNTDQATVYIDGGKQKQIYWVRRGDRVWYRLDEMPADIVSLRHKGVYIIWYFDERRTARTVKVGGGELAACLVAARKNSRVQRYATRGTLYVTWAVVGESYINGVVGALRQKLEPFVGQHDLNYIGVRVGLPSRLRWY